MKLFDLLKDIDYEILSGCDTEITELCIDSRKCTEGSLFACLEERKENAHLYIDKAISAGAKAVIVYEKTHDFPKDTTIVYVPDGRLAFNTISANFYNHVDKTLRIHGITGTKGKTSISHFVQYLFKNDGRKCGVIGTTGVFIDGASVDIPFVTPTTPDTHDLYKIFSIMKKEGVTDVIMEVSSHSLALKKLTLINFESAIFTNLTHDHLDYHKTFKNYREAKAKLFRQTKLGIINIDDASAEYIMVHGTCRFKTYGIKKECDYKANGVILRQDGVSFESSGTEYNFDNPGEFSIYNIMSVIALAHELGIPQNIISKTISELKGVPGRMQRIENSKNLNIIIDYAHTPDSLKSMLVTIKNFTIGRVITIFGCGGDRDTLKRPIMGEIAGRLSDYCILTSDNPRSENPEKILCDIEIGINNTSCQYIKEADRKKAIYEGIKMATPDDCVLIAGKGHENYQELADGIKIHFDDYEIAYEIINALD